MKNATNIAILAALSLLVCKVRSATLYVDVSGSNPIPPFTDWSSAAVTIQDAVDVAVDGDLVLVTNGVYNTGGRTMYGALTNRIAVDKAITVQSVNGPDFTSIEGLQPNGEAAVRCAYLTNGATLSGFTLTNGATYTSFFGDTTSNKTYFTSGGGAWCENTSALLTNCVIVSNTCSWWGAGVYSGALNQCLVRSNWNLNGSQGGGGGAAFSTVLNSMLQGNHGDGSGAFSSVLSNCLVTGNSRGGASISAAAWNCQLYGCTVRSNYGSGIYRGSANNCIVSYNDAATGYYGGGANFASLSNCVIFGNRASAGGGAYNCGLDFCSVSNNYATNYGGGVYWTSGTQSVSPPGNNNLLVNNSAGRDGGGLYLQTFMLAPALTNWTLQGNSATANGGGIYVGQGTWTLQGFTFTSNSAPSSGGGAYLSGSQLLQDCSFTGNSTATNGGGLFGTGASGYTCGRTTFTNNSAGANGGGANGAILTNCSLFGNVAASGGGAYAGTLADCWLGSNTATQHGGGAAQAGVTRCWFDSNSAVLNGGGMYFSSSGAPTGCTLVNNRAGNGGGIYLGFGGATGCSFLTNSARTNGGGLCCAGNSQTTRDCIFTGNQAMLGGGAYHGSYPNCTFIGNMATNSGGGAYLPPPSGVTSTNCLITGNWAGTNGAGIFGATWVNCKFRGNTAGGNGGAANSASLTRCVVTDNTAAFGGGGYNTAWNQCLVARNSAGTGGGAYCTNINTVLFSTLVANTATNTGGGVYSVSAQSPIGTSILYFNAAPTAANYASPGAITNCCLLPLAAGTANIASDPLLIDLLGGNYRLQTNSPCINTGAGNPQSAIDLDGHPRVVGGVLDIGAYEFHGAGGGEFTFWLQQNGLPINGSADYADTDSDLMNNWQEWIAGTSPTNAQSVLKLVSLPPSPSGATLAWQSVSGRNYWVERSGDLSSPAGFSMIQSNIPGLVGLTTLTDTDATNSVAYFYRVGVR